MNEPFVIRAMIAGIALAAIAAPLGCFVVWRRMAYFGETVAQGGLIGVALGLLLSVDPSLSVLLTTIGLSLLLLVLARQQLLPLDSLLGLLAHAALAIGIVMASMLRGLKPDLMSSILFGEIFAVTRTDLAWIAVGGSVALGLLFWIWRPLLSASLHEDLAKAEGIPVERIKLVFALVLAIVVAVALKVVGALLTIAFLIMPAAIARPFAETPEQMAFLAVILAMLAVGLGLFVSNLTDAPGGAAIVLVLTAMFAAGVAAHAVAERRD
jgi:zinc transport system permease protein